MNDMEYFLDEGKRKETRKNNRQVSSEKKYVEDLEKHDFSDIVIDDIKKIIQLFKEREDAYLKSNYDAHELEGPFNGFSSLHLYPGEYGDRDIVLLYKIHRNDHVVLHGTLLEDSHIRCRNGRSQSIWWPPV